MTGLTPLGGAPLADLGGPPPVVNYNAAQVEAGTAAETQSALVVFASAQIETLAATDTSDGATNKDADRAEALTASDLPSAALGFNVSFDETSSSIVELQDGLVVATVFASDTLSIADDSGSFVPIPTRSVNELAPLTDEATTPPFVPGLADVQEFLDAQDLNTASIMQSVQQVNEVALISDTSIGLANQAYEAARDEVLSAADTSNGAILVYFTALGVETAVLAETTNGLPGTIADVHEEAYLLIDFSVASITPVASVAEFGVASDSRSGLFGALRAQVEALSAADTSSIPAPGQMAARIEALTLVDQQSAAASFGVRSVAEILNAVDHPASTGAVFVSRAEILSLVDTQTQTPQFTASRAEVMNLADLIGVPSVALAAALVEILQVLDASAAQFVVFRTQAETANASDTSNAAVGLNYFAADNEALAIMDSRDAVIPYTREHSDVLRATDRVRALDVSGFILGNPERVTIEYRRRVWVLSSTKQE